jgi:hypothetical protein
MTEIIIRQMTKEEIAQREAWVIKQAELERKIVEDARLAAYQRESDPLFFGWQRGDNTQQEWLEAIQAVKDAYPYPK